MHHGLVTCKRGWVRGVIMSIELSEISSFWSSEDIKWHHCLVFLIYTCTCLLDHWNMEIYIGISAITYPHFCKIYKLCILILIFTAWIFLTSELCIYIHVLYIPCLSSEATKPNGTVHRIRGPMCHSMYMFSCIPLACRKMQLIM